MNRLNLDNTTAHLFMSFFTGILLVIFVTNILTISYIGHGSLDPADWRRGTLVVLAWIGIVFQIVISLISIIGLYDSDEIYELGGHPSVLWFFLIGGWLFQISNILIITYLGPDVPKDDPIDATDDRRVWIFGLSILIASVTAILLIWFLFQGIRGREPTPVEIDEARRQAFRERLEKGVQKRREGFEKGIYKPTAFSSRPRKTRDNNWSFSQAFEDF
jgi:hypothetical protein